MLLNIDLKLVNSNLIVFSQFYYPKINKGNKQKLKKIMIRKVENFHSFNFCRLMIKWSKVSHLLTHLLTLILFTHSFILPLSSFINLLSHSLHLLTSLLSFARSFTHLVICFKYLWRRKSRWRRRKRKCTK